jgi:hypothetical protein
MTMRIRTSRRRAFVACWGVLLGFAAFQAKGSPTPALDGLVVIDFSKLSPEPEFQGKRGIFRDQNEPPEIQFISEDLVMEDVRGEQMGCLRLIYRFGAPGRFNGYWVQPDKKNWEDFRGGALLLRVLADAKMPPLFKLELKTASSEGGPQTTFPVYVVLNGPETKKALRTKGYADVAIRLDQLAVTQSKIDPNTLQTVTERKVPDLRFVNEITLVFEADRLRDNPAGIVKLNSIRLVKDLPKP